MKDILILAIETSCDETSLAIVKNGKEVIKEVTNSQADEFSTIGGVVPEMASRMHLDNILYVYEELFDDITLTIEDMDYIAVTYGPGLIGSLMVGVNFANTLSYVYNKKIIPVNHMQGHIYSSFIENEIEFPHMSLIVSGGHTDIVYMESHNKFNYLGYTLDDAIGECYDKIAKILGFGYPGGPIIDKLASTGKNTIKMPIPMNNKELLFSFSGLKSHCFNYVNQAKMKNEEINSKDFACSFQTTAVDLVFSKLDIAIEQYKPNSISIVGGVSANSEIRKRAEERNIITPSLKLTTDNASMIGCVAFYMLEENIECDFVRAMPNIEVQDRWNNN